MNAVVALARAALRSAALLTAVAALELNLVDTERALAISRWAR